MLHHFSQSDLTVFTVATGIGRRLPAFLESCRRLEIAPVLLGLGSRWTGHMMKLNLLAEALDSCRSRLVLMTDSYDAVFIRPLSDVVARYVTFGHPMVCSSQPGCWPDAALEDRYPPAPTQYRTVNAGGYMAERTYLQGLLRAHQDLMRESNWDDQLYFTKVFLRDNELFRLDYWQEIFGTCGDVNLERTAGGLKNVSTGSFPCVIHGNGGTPLRSVLTWCGLAWNDPPQS